MAHRWAGGMIAALFACAACGDGSAPRPQFDVGAEIQDSVPQRREPEYWASRLRDPSSAVRREALASLGEAGPAASAFANLIVPLLADPDQRTGYTAAWALAHMGMGAQPLLFAELNSANPRVRERAVYGVGEMGPAGADALERVKELQDDRDDRVREMAGWAAGEVTVRRMVADPNMLLTQGLQGTRQERLEAIERLGIRAPSSRVAVRTLIALLADSVPAVRTHAIQALADAGPMALPSLSAALSHRNRLIRRGALLAISRMHRVF